MKPHYLNDLFSPKHIAVIGASDKPQSIGQEVFAHLLAGQFKGKLTPVNLRHNLVGGITAVNHVGQIAEPVDVAVVLTPAASLAGILRECHKSKIKYIVLVKSNEEQSAADADHLSKAVQLAKKLGLRLLGPSVLGLIRPVVGLNASTYGSEILPGNLALVSQSSALCTAMLDWAGNRGIGFSTVLSLGDQTSDIHFGEILDFLTHDRATEAILLHIHHVSNGRQFMSALRAAARLKPVVVIKSGRDEDQVTGLSIASELLDSTDVFNSALARAGVLRVHSISQMFTAVKVLAANYRATGNRLAIVCNGIGLGVLAADTAHDLQVPLAVLTESTINALNEALPANWSHANPVDVLGDAGPLRFRTAVKLCLDDEQVDGVLVIFTPQVGTDHLTTAQMMVQLQRESSKPLMLSWLGDAKVKESRDLFTRSRCVQFNAPEYAVEVFRSLGRYHKNQELLMQTPRPLAGQWQEANFDAAHKLLAKARRQKLKVLPEHLSKELLNIFHILANRTELAQSEDEACAVAAQMGYPVVLKIDSPDIFHKSDIGGVRLNLHDEPALREAYQQIMERAQVMAPQALIHGVTVQPMLQQRHAREVMVSVAHDPVFGPVITFGAGGLAATVQQDTASALPPLNDFLIQDMIARTKAAQTFGLFKNMQPIDTEALKNVLLRVSEMVSELPEIMELEINPLLVSPQGAIALDARVVLSPKVEKADRYGHMAIMPYPHYLETHHTLKDGSAVLVRPSRPEDADMVQAFVRNLSDESRYNRFMSSIKELSQSVLVRFTQLDYDREMALVMVKARADGTEETLGIARYVTDPDMEVCEFATSVADEWQGHGIGTILMNLLFDAARQQGLKLMRGEILTSNAGMHKLMKKLGFSIRKDPDDNSIYQVEKILQLPENATEDTKME